MIQVRELSNDSHSTMFKEEQTADFNSLAQQTKDVVEQSSPYLEIQGREDDIDYDTLIEGSNRNAEVSMRDAVLHDGLPEVG